MKKTSKAAAEYLRLGLDMLQTGDLETALKALRVAVADMPRSQDARIGLAQALRRSGDPGEAAVVLSDALAIPPVSRLAALQFSALMKRFRLDDPADLNPAGLRAALSCQEVDRQPVVRTAFDWLKTSGVLKKPVQHGLEDGWDAAAAAVLADRKRVVCRDGLLREALAAGFNTDPEIEFLLAALRKQILLGVEDSELLRDKELFAFALALAAQVDSNEHVWPISPGEQEALDALSLDKPALLAGAAEAAPALVKTLLYRSFGSAGLTGVPADQVARIRPKALGALIVPLAAARQEEHALSEALPSFNEIEDPTSRRVAGQYEKSPYPRWSSLNTDAAAIRLDEIARVFGEDAAVRFREAPFDVLVAGCGTGHHAAQLAVAYGAQARILGVDLSRASLAYAQRMTGVHGLTNLSFAQADLLDAKAIGRNFDVIECIGVLHHMADPFAGWRAVLEVLKPGGLMFVGLYSAVARRGIAELRAAPEYPGPGCDDETARAYRARLFAAGAENGGTALSQSQDFYTLSDFRDLALHESEQHLTLEDIGGFLSEAGLEFCGFALDAGTMSRFKRAYPEADLPGALECWAEFERNNPETFEGMYNFWCRRLPVS